MGWDILTIAVAAVLAYYAGRVSARHAIAEYFAQWDAETDAIAQQLADAFMDTDWTDWPEDDDDGWGDFFIPDPNLLADHPDNTEPTMAPPTEARELLRRMLIEANSMELDGDDDGAGQ